MTVPVITEVVTGRVPIIAGSESGATSLATEGVEDFIVSPHKPRQITGARLWFAQGTILNLRMGEAARRQGAAQNTWQDYGDRLLAEYQKRLAARKTTPGA